MKHDSDIVRQLDAAEDSFKRSRLRTMQRIALGLLIVAAMLFALARSRHGGHPAWGYLEAFAEAAMVGAMADWFAVVALFRHPLGIPVWHTAIIPNSKDSIAANLGTFVENHFITEEGIAQRIRQADFAGRAGEWLRDPGHAQQAGSALTGIIAQALDKLDDEKMRIRIRDLASSELGKLDLSSLAGGYLDTMLGKGTPQALLDPLLENVITWLGDENNHETAGQFILGCFSIENTMMKSMVLGYVPKLIGSLREQAINVRMDRKHPLRTHLDTWMADSAMRLKADAGWKDSIARYQASALRDADLQRALGGMWDSVRRRLKDDLQSGDPVIAYTVQQMVQEAGRLLGTDHSLRNWLNGAIESASAALVRRYRGEVGRFIEQQLAKWTKQEMSTRIELAIGRDLQFIRINGTLVGGLVGLAIYAFASAF